MPDERAVMTYVSSYYHTFTGVQKVSGYAGGACMSVPRAEMCVIEYVNVEVEVVFWNLVLDEKVGKIGLC